MKQPQPWFRTSKDAWYVELHGKQYRLAKGKENEEAAYQAYHELMANPPQPEKPRDPKYFDALCAEFMEWTKPQWAPKTFRQAALYLDSFNDAWPDLLAAELKPLHVTAWLKKRKLKTQNSRRSLIAIIKRVTSWAVDEGWLTADPLARLKLPAMEARDTLMPPEIHAKLCQHVPKQTALALIALKLSGARPDEICRVTKDMVDLENGQWVLKDHKTKKKVRTPRIIYLSPCLQTLTRILLAGRKGQRLFVNQYGRPLKNRTIGEGVAAVREKYQLPEDITPYCYRHTYATDGLRNGVPIAVMAKLLGHKDVTMISRVYGHLEKHPDHLLNAAKRVQAPREPDPGTG